MKSPFQWGQGGRAMTPEDVARERELVALARAKMGDTSPVGHWTQGATRVVDALGAVLREKRTNKAEAAGLAGADERIAAILSGQGGGFGGGGGYTASTAGQGAPGVVAPVVADPAAALGDDAMAALGKPAMPTGADAASIRAGLVARGLPEHVADGFVMNFQDESGLNPGINEISPTVPGSRGGYGIYQLTGPRRRAYEAFAAERGIPLDSVDGQLDFLMAELQGPESAAARAILSTKDAGSAGAAIVKEFLRPSPEYAKRRASEYLGGQPPTYDTAGGAPAIPGGSGGMDIASLLALQSDPWVAKKYGGVVDALMGQQFSRQNALWEQQQRMSDPMYQAQLEMAQLELGKAQAPQVADPFAGTKEIGGVLYGSDGQGGFVPLITPPAAGGARPLTDPAERAQWGIPATDTRPYAIEAGKPPTVVGGAGVTVNNDLGGADKFEEAFAKGDAATIETVNNAGLAAQRNIGRIDQLESILGSTPTGMGASLAQAAGEWGIPTEGLSEIQAAEALINSLVPEQRQPGSGPMSDADLALFKKSLPRIINQPGGNQVILGTMRAIAQYDAEGAAIVQRMRLPPDDPNYLDRSAAFSALQNRPNPLESIKAAGGGGDVPDSSGVPAGIDPTDWQFMTPEERALFK